MESCVDRIGRWPSVALAVACASSAGAVWAQSAVLDVVESQSCLRGGITRVLELREGPDGGLPCEVVYLKPDEDGSSRVMWLARNDRAFCTARFESFVVKLETRLAWECEPQEAAEATASRQATSETASSRSSAVDESDTVEATEATEATEAVDAADGADTADTETGADTEDVADAADAAEGPDAVTASDAEATAAANAPARSSAGGTSTPPEELASRERERASADGDELRIARSPASSPRVDAADGDSPSARARGNVPELARAAPEPATGSGVERMAALRELIPSGPYRLTSGGEPCPPGGSFFWNTRDPDRPVFEMGPTAELPVLLPAEIDETLVLTGEPEEGGEASSGDGEPGVRTLALDGARSDGRGRTIELRVRPSGAGGAGGERVCRYALGG